MVKLTEHFGTKYLYASYAGDIATLIQQNPEETIDIGGARLVKRCLDVIQQQGVANCVCTFVDTEDPERNAILEYNQKQAKIARDYTSGAIRVQSLPIPVNREDMQHYLAKDYGSITWKCGVNSEKAFLWTALLQSRRPDVRLYTLGTLEQLIGVICKYFPSRRNVGRKVMYCDQGLLLTNYDPTPEFLDTHACVSTDFGSVNLWTLPEWKEPLHRMVDAFMAIIEPTTTHIRDYL